MLDGSSRGATTAIMNWNPVAATGLVVLWGSVEMAARRHMLLILPAGSVSGPLLLGVFLNFRKGRPVLGSLYAAAFTE